MNIKRLFIFLFIIYFFSIGVAFSDELVGPKIFGLQLGMDFDKAKKIGEEYSNNNCKEDNVDAGLRLLCIKDNNSNVNMTLVFKNDKLDRYGIGVGAFNYKQNMDWDNFIKNLISNYNIPKVDYDSTYGIYFYKDHNKGWMFTANNSTISVITIEKAQDFNFK